MMIVYCCNIIDFNFAYSALNWPSNYVGTHTPAKPTLLRTVLRRLKPIPLWHFIADLYFSAKSSGGFEEYFSLVSRFCSHHKL
jgi:hypothetical protein